MLTAGIPTALPRVPALAALAGLLALAWVAATRTAAPPAQPAPDAPPALDRMLRHVSVLAAAPRPIATAANARARDYIIGQLRGMGLAPTVQKATIHTALRRRGRWRRRGPSCCAS